MPYPRQALTIIVLLLVTSIALAAPSPTPEVPGFSRLGVVRVLQWPDFYRGPANRVQVANGFAYVASGVRGFHTVDIRDPANPVRIASTQLAPTDPLADAFDVLKVVSRDAIAYVQTASRLMVFDLSVPAAPFRIADRWPGVRDIDFIGSGLFAISRYDLESLKDDPLTPYSQALIPLDTVWALGGRGSHVYAASYGTRAIPASFVVVDHESGTQLRRRGEYPISRLGFPSDGSMVIEIEAEDGRAYLQANRWVGDDKTSRIEAIDVSNPDAPASLGGFSYPGVSGFRVRNQSGFVAAHSRGLFIENWANPDAPVRIARVPSLDTSLDVELAEDLAYIADGDAGLQIFDVSRPARPRWLSEVDLGGVASDVVVNSNIAYVADGGGGLRLLDLSRTSNPVVVSRLQLGSRVVGVGLSGSVLSMVTSKAGASVDSTDANGVLHLADVSVPTTPMLRGQLEIAPAIRGHRTIGDRTYVAADTSGLIVIDTSDLDHPVELGRFNTFGTAFDVEVMGSRAYVADGQQGLQIYDVSDPRVPRRIGGYATASPARRVAVSGRYAFVLGGSNANSGSVEIVDVSFPENTRKIASWSSDGFEDRIHVSGDLAFHSTRFGVHLYDISRIDSPEYIESIRWPNPGAMNSKIEPGGMIFDGRRLTLTAGTLGVASFDLTTRQAATITLESPREVVLGDAPLEISAASSSGLPVSIIVLDGPGRIVDGRLEALGYGSITLRAEQSADRQFFAASKTAVVRVAVRLRASRSPEGITLSWPRAARDLQLQRSTAPGLGATWISLGNGQDSGVNELSFLVPFESDSAFFRLAR